MVKKLTKPKLDKHYDRTPVEDRLAEYIKTMELLTISPENILRKKLAHSEMTVNVKLSRLASENQRLRKDMNGIIRGYQETIRMLKNPRFAEKVKKYNNTKK